MLQAYRSYAGDFKRLTDVVRCSLILDTPDDMIRLLKASFQHENCCQRDTAAYFCTPQRIVDQARIVEPEDQGPFLWAKLLWTAFLVRILGIVPIDDDAAPSVSPSDSVFFDLLRVRFPVCRLQELLL